MNDPLADQALIDWIRKEGGYVHEGLDLFKPRPDGCGRAVATTAPIQSGQQLLLIPETLTLHIPEGDDRQTEKCKLVEALLGEDVQHLSSFLQTVLLFIGERAKGGTSRYAPYFQTLPTSIPPALITWKDADCELLVGTSLENHSDGRFFRKSFEDELLPWMQRHPEIFPQHVQSMDLAQSAAAYVQSRAFHMRAENWVTHDVFKIEDGSTLFLVPGIDMLNHVPHRRRVNTELVKSTDRLTVDTDDGKQIVVSGYFSLNAARDIGTGEEILLSYGDLGDAALMRIYGFVTPAEILNTDNYVILKYTTIREACERVISKHKWPIEKFGEREVWVSNLLDCFVEHLPEVEFHLTVDALLTEKLISIVQWLLLPTDQLEEIEKEYRDDEKTMIQLGMEYLDESEWTYYVLIAFLEIAHLLETNLSRNPCSSGSVDSEYNDLVTTVARGEREILHAFKRDTLSLMPMNESTTSDDAEWSEAPDDSETVTPNKKAKHS